MLGLFLTTNVILLVLLSSFAQTVEPVPAPADVILTLGTEGDLHQFRLGELIPVKFSYSAKVPGRYFLVGRSSKLAGGRSLEISCSPSAVRVILNPRSLDDVTFHQMLNSPCDGAGIGGGSGGGCGDCDDEYPLAETALTFGVVPMNTYVRFRTPGTYTCEALSADVTTARPDEKIRTALLVKSDSIILTIVNDPGWAHSAALEYAEVYEKLCRGDGVAEHGFLQCSDLARRITYLDNADSLATEVKWFDGRSHGWENGFGDAIRHSANREEALRLMAARMQEPDFEVSTSVLEWLASSELRMEVPDAFQSDAPATYHAHAVEKLRKYVRLLGDSLSRKDSTVFSESARTYRTFAEQKFCESQSLIPTEEQNQALTGRALTPRHPAT